MRRLFKDLGDDAELARRWAQTGLGPLHVREALGDPEQIWEFEVDPDEVWVTAMLDIEIIDDP